MWQNVLDNRETTLSLKVLATKITGTAFLVFVGHLIPLFSFVAGIFVDKKYARRELNNRETQTLTVINNDTSQFERVAVF